MKVTKQILSGITIYIASYRGKFFGQGLSHSAAVMACWEDMHNE